MEIILGKTAGFCYGVKNAVEEAQKEIHENEKIYCLGEIVHNKSVIKALEKKGIQFVENINDVSGTVIIRAHGATKNTYNILKQKGIKIKDLTCPNVIKTHEIAEKYSRQNYFIILIGIKNHPEALATLSFCGNNYFLVQEKDDITKAIEKIKKTKIENVLIMAQTTYNSNKFDDMVETLKNELKEKNVKVQKTICTATEIRQKETIEISKKVDIMIIIGDKKSSNTNKLYDISKENCKKVIFIQKEQEFNLEEIKEANKIGIMAGASTPKEDIENIIDKLNERKEDKIC